MGGLLFKTQRLPIDEFNEYRQNIESILKSHSIEYKIPLYYKDKKDFGDLDILIKNTVPASVLMDIFKDCEYQYDRRNPCVSFNYENFQIDFIRIEPENFDIAFHYYSYNDLGNLIGQLAKFKSLKFGFDGLKYVHYEHIQKKGVVYISKNIDEILTFLDLNPFRYHRGFDTIKDVFEFVVKSKYFNPYVSDLEPYAYTDAGIALYRINKVNRERNTKRKTYMEWLEYVKQFKTGEDDYEFRMDGNLDEVYKEVDEFFPNAHIYDKLKSFKTGDKLKKLINDKFNGNLIKELIPDIEKTEMQHFINAFKKEISNFDEYVLSSDQESIKNDILNFNQIYKTK